MDATAAAPTPSGAEPPWLAITLAAIAVLGPLGVAYMPVIQERVRARSTARTVTSPDQPVHASPPPPPHSPPPAPPTESLALIREVLADALAQRDAAVKKAEQAEDELTEARIHIARLEARGRYGP